jgi:putative tricarboxylic transport membrane protein
MLSTELPMTFSFVWMIAIASVVATLVLLKTVNQVAKVALLPGQLVVPGVLLFVFMGAWLGGASIGDWLSCAVFGVIGFLMKRGGWPRPPVILALVLGEILERSFQISTRIHEGPGWLGRPIVIFLLLVIITTIFLAVRGVARDKLAGKVPAGEASEKNPAISLPISLLLFVVFIWAAYTALDWPPPVRQFPLLIAVPAVLLSLTVIIKDMAHLQATKKAAGSWQLTLRKAGQDAWLAEALPFFTYVFGMIVMTLIVGQKIALPLFIGVYVVRWGHYSKRVAVAYALSAWAILVFFYDQVMSLLFHPSYLALWLRPLLPAGVPEWLFL